MYLVSPSHGVPGLTELLPHRGLLYLCLFMTFFVIYVSGVSKLPIGRRYRNANHESQQRRQVRQVRGPEAGGEVYSQGERKTNFLHTFSATF